MLDFDEEPNVDLTPLIDVIFMLLIFFIMTTTFSRPVLDIVLPSSESAAPSKVRQEQVISIMADGTLHYEGHPIEKSNLPTIFPSRSQ